MNKVFKMDYDRTPYYAKFVTHKISRALVPIFARIHITPNQVTALTIIFGLAGGLFFILGKPLSILLGALLIEVYYVFDAVDGQLARYKDQTSLTGAYFDYIGSRIVHAGVFLSIGFGVFLNTGELVYVISGVLAGWGMLMMYALFEAEASVLLDKLKGSTVVFKTPGRAGKTSGPKRFVSPKFYFSILHKLCTYPTVMNVITIAAVANFVIYMNKGTPDNKLFEGLLLFYGAAITVVWVFKLAHRISVRDIDNNFKERIVKYKDGVQ